MNCACVNNAFRTPENSWGTIHAIQVPNQYLVSLYYKTAGDDLAGHDNLLRVTVPGNLILKAQSSKLKVRGTMCFL